MLKFKTIMFALSMIVGAGAVADVVGTKWIGLAVVIVGAVRGALDFYEHGLNTPVPTAEQPQR
jgi:hypothetical protein